MGDQAKSVQESTMATIISNMRKACSDNNAIAKSILTQLNHFEGVSTAESKAEKKPSSGFITEFEEIIDSMRLNNEILRTSEVFLTKLVG